MSLRIVSGILLIIGFIGGTIANSVEPVQPAKRGGYKVLEADFHVHSFFGDGVLSPFNLVLYGQSKGLHAFAVTNHNQTFSAKMARWFSNLIDGPTILVGQEITSPQYHIIGVGLTETVDWKQSVTEAIDAVHEQGGAAIAAHPVFRYWPTYTNDVLAKLDGSEVMHLMAYTEARWPELRDFYLNAAEKGISLTAIGSSDFHWFNWLGLSKTYVFVHDNTEEEIVEALRCGRTVVYDLKGNAYGDPELIDLLQKQPIETEAGDYAYTGSSKLDVVTRACGWFGLLGLVVFGRFKGE